MLKWQLIRMQEIREQPWPVTASTDSTGERYGSVYDALVRSVLDHYCHTRSALAKHTSKAVKKISRVLILFIHMLMKPRRTIW